MFAVEVHNLSKAYRNSDGSSLVAVDRVTFGIASGECFGLLGPNGAGKSTTIKCLTGFYAPSSGRVAILGVDAHANPKTARGSLGVCSQDDTLDTDFRVLDQMVQYASYFRIGKKAAVVRAERLLDRFGLSGKKDELVEALSGGMRRRLQVARSLINDPRVIVLDEPTTGLDPEVRRALWEIIREERQRGVAILLSTHYMDEAERLCDRVAILHRGRILACASPQALIREQVGVADVFEEIRPGVVVTRPPNLEDVYLKATGARLGGG